MTLMSPDATKRLSTTGASHEVVTALRVLDLRSLYLSRRPHGSRGVMSAIMREEEATV